MHSLKEKEYRIATSSQTTSTKDIIIIGGGIAGLYYAYKIKQQQPTINFLVLERNNKKRLGGRMGNTNFYGQSVVTGAGIGRKEKDKLLTKLLEELNVPFHEFPSGHQYADTITPPCNVRNTFMTLRREYNKNREEGRHKTFKEFAISILGITEYSHFILCAGYTDYENEDTYNTLYNYGFEDNFTNWTGLSIPWRKLIDALVEKIGGQNIRTSENVREIIPLQVDQVETPSISMSQSQNQTNQQTKTPNFIIETDTHQYVTTTIIVATTIDSVLKIVPNANSKTSLYRQIHGQPFLRMYGKFSKSSIPIMKEYVPSLMIIPTALQKILPINTDEGIYMISYSDNKHANALKRYLENTTDNRRYLSRMIERALNIKTGSLQLLSIMDIYWTFGTHYYEPLHDNYKNREQFINAAQHPMPNMQIVGEMISINQGWVEGALESVEKVLYK
jgi:hypothetical protein